MTQFAFSLFGGKIVAIVHVLVLAQVRRDLTHLSVKLEDEKKSQKLDLSKLVYKTGTHNKTLM